MNKQIVIQRRADAVVNLNEYLDLGCTIHSITPIFKGKMNRGAENESLIIVLNITEEYIKYADKLMRRY